MKCCAFSALELLLKTIDDDLYREETYGSCLNKISLASQLFPQPVGPKSIKLLRQMMLASTKYPSLMDSVVGRNRVKMDPDLL